MLFWYVPEEIPSTWSSKSIWSIYFCLGNVISSFAAHLTVDDYKVIPVPGVFLVLEMGQKTLRLRWCICGKVFFSKAHTWTVLQVLFCADGSQIRSPLRFCHLGHHNGTEILSWIKCPELNNIQTTILMGQQLLERKSWLFKYELCFFNLLIVLQNLKCAT